MCNKSLKLSYNFFVVLLKAFFELICIINAMIKEQSI
jgi:hypothetical protein